MLMGRLIRHKTYSTREYITALVLVAGACSFFLSSQSFNTSNKVTTASGLILMAGYLVFDAYTPNYQKILFELKPKISRTQASFGIRGIVFHYKIFR